MREFSVLMSVYHKENADHFRLALNSNLEQTRMPKEFVLVCDGPLTDKLDQVIAEFQTRYPNIFHIVPLAENKGLGNALQIGMEHCSCEFVARSDSDDICVSDRFEKQLAYLEAHPEISVVGGAIDEFEDDYTKPLRRKELPLQHKDLFNFAKKRNPLNHMTVMFRKADILQAGSYQPLSYLEDYYLWLRVLGNGYQIANLPDCVVHARVGNGMQERRGSKKYISGWKTLNSYMMEKGMITRVRAFTNMVRIGTWCRMSGKMRGFVYDNILRKRISK